MKTKKNSKGFTLVELVVVIGIIGILAAILVPSLMYYVKKAKRTAAIADAKTILTGTQTAVLEAGLAGNTNIKLTKTGGKIRGESVNLGGLTNTAMNNALGGGKKTNTNATDTEIADSILTMISTARANPGEAKKGSEIFGKNCQSYMDSVGANYCFIILYGSDGNVPFMQIYNKGILVTYANGTFIANDKDNAKFISLGNSFSIPFVEAGKDSSEISSDLKNSKFPTKWG